MKPAPTAPAIWFPAIRAGSGADIFTERLVSGLRKHGIRAEITWLPHRAEYAPWTVTPPRKPAWANIAHVNTWLHRRFLPEELPIVATMHHCVHDPFLHHYKSRAQALYHRIWIKPLESEILNRAAKVTAVSRYTANRTREIFGTSDIVVIPNGIDPNGSFQPSHKPTAPHHPFRLLFVGNWSVRKGCDLLAPIMQLLGNEFELWILTGLRGRHPINSLRNIHFLERRADDNALALLYQECDALLFPSRLEGFGMVALEALSCGLPVIATNGSALPEVVEDGVSGLLCSPETPEEFAQAARHLAEDETFFDSLRGSARRRVIQHFDLMRIIERYLALYESMLMR